MPLNYANSPIASAHRIVFVLTSGTVLLDVTGPLQAFHEARQTEDHTPCYEIILASVRGGAVVTDTGFTLDTITLDQAAEHPIHTLIVAGSDEHHIALSDQSLMAWLVAQRPKVKRVASICIGAFLLGTAGYLDGRRAVTHWRWCERLQNHCPKAHIEQDPIFVQDGPVWTSAGVTAGIDMAIAMIEQDLGHDAALAVARSLIVFIRRPGGQSQFSLPLQRQSHDRSGRFDALHVWMQSHLQARLSVEDLAAQAHMSPRNFSRTYHRDTGISPAKSVELMRLEAARHHLEQGDTGIAQIATLCGFGDDERMRRCFVKHLGVAPADYRNRFKASLSA
ncbi:MAG: helix-turn-helix domain-containing protein [Pseudomonadota bacterium]